MEGENEENGGGEEGGGGIMSAKRKERIASCKAGRRKMVRKE